MFELVVNSSNEVKILTPFNYDLNDIKKEITQIPNGLHTIVTYPNGVIIDMTQYANKIIIKCNHQLIDNGNGTVSIII